MSIRREIERPNVRRSTSYKRAREISEIFPELFRNGGSGGGCPIMNTFLCAISISPIHHEAYFSRYGPPRRRISYCVEDGDMGEGKRKLDDKFADKHTQTIHQKLLPEALLKCRVRN